MAGLGSLARLGKMGLEAYQSPGSIDQRPGAVTGRLAAKGYCVPVRWQNLPAARGCHRPSSSERLLFSSPLAIFDSDQEPPQGQE